MKTSNISSSSMIERVTFDDGEMVVYFKTGSSATYTNVPEDVYESFVKATSIGKFYNVNIKGKYN